MEEGTEMKSSEFIAWKEEAETALEWAGEMMKVADEIMKLASDVDGDKFPTGYWCAVCDNPSAIHYEKCPLVLWRKKYSEKMKEIGLL
jgi:hypothetical protein